MPHSECSSSLEVHTYLRAALIRCCCLFLVPRLITIIYRPLDPKAHHNLGVCLDALGEKTAALGCFEKAFELDRRMADSGANAAGLLLRTGWEGEAERACALCYLVSDFTQHRFPPSCGGPSCPHAWVQSVQVLKIVMPFRLVRHITPLDGGPVLLPVDHHSTVCHAMSIRG